MADTQHVDESPVTQVPLAEIFPGDSPRQGGVDFGHARRLADSEDPLPPIVVNRRTMRVIDGMHRLNAAIMRGQEVIDVRFFEGDEADAFVLAVRANVTHGLPLSLADRKAAASRILDLHPGWSNRAVAHVSGLSANTVAQLRERPTGQIDQLDARVGRDGRKRPVNSAERRALAAKLMRKDPDSSLRDIARRAGISPETARNVRAQLNRETGSAGGLPGARAPRRGMQLVGVRHPDQLLRALAADPAIRSSELGRMLLRALAASLSLDDRDARLAQTLPGYRLSDVMLAVQACAATWQRLAERLEQRRTELAE
jgi:lambda repressor-like predicted transcriptional regulator